MVESESSETQSTELPRHRSESFNVIGREKSDEVGADGVRAELDRVGGKSHRRTGTTVVYAPPHLDDDESVTAVPATLSLHDAVRASHEMEDTEEEVEVTENDEEAGVKG